LQNQERVVCRFIRYAVKTLTLFQYSVSADCAAADRQRDGRTESIITALCIASYADAQ